MLHPEQNRQSPPSYALLDHVEFGRHDRQALAPARRAQPERPDDGAHDWDALFDTVTIGLNVLAREGLISAAPGPARTLAHAVQANVLGCVDAVNQLRANVASARARTHDLELELFDARTALAQAGAASASGAAGAVRAWHPAIHDESTALSDRGAVGAWLEQAVADTVPRSEGLAVLHLALDGCAPINDRLGHDAVDGLLRVVAARLARAVRAQDLVCRLAGDAFACLLTDVSDREQIGQRARMLREAVAMPIMLGVHEVTLHPSIGIALWPAHGSDADAVLDNAGNAVSRARRQRCGYAFFN